MDLFDHLLGLLTNYEVKQILILSKLAIDVITEWNYFSLGFLDNDKEFSCKTFSIIFRKFSHFYNKISTNHSPPFRRKNLICKNWLF